MGYWQKGSTSTTIPPTSTSAAVEHDKIEGINFGASYLQMKHAGSGSLLENDT